MKKKKILVNFIILILKLVNIKNYVDRILKHISKEESFEKCLNLLKTLLINYSSELKPLVIFKIFNRIINLDFKFKTPSNVKTIKGNNKFFIY